MRGEAADEACQPRHASPIAVQSRLLIRKWKVSEARIKVNGSSATNNGWTSAILEIEIDTAWSKKPVTMVTIPKAQMGRCARSQNMCSGN